MYGMKLFIALAIILLVSSIMQAPVFNAEAIAAIVDTDKDEISLGQDLTIRVAEPDANLDSRTIERIPFNVLLITTNKFDETPLDEVLEKTGIRSSQKSLMETGFNTGIFEVTLESINDSLVTRGHDIEITYLDNSPSGGGSQIRIEKTVHVGKASISVKFDKKEYTPFDTIQVTVVAQMLDTNRDKIDTLNTSSAGRVAITTAAGQTYYPPMFETSTNSGVFVGKIKLTSDIASKEGDIVVKSGDRIKVTVAIIPGVEVSDSTVITTMLGSISFDISDYAVGDTVNVIVRDRDENMDSDLIDSLQVKIWSGTDPEGMFLTLHELGLFSGTFEGKFTLGERSDVMLAVSDDDMIFAKYQDRTVPSLTQPATKDLFVSAKVGSPANADVLVSDHSLFDQNGIELQTLKAGTLAAVQSSLTNSKAERLQFVYITHIMDSDGFTVQLAFVKGNLEPFQSLKVGRSWVPDLPGKYTLEVLVWNNTVEPSILSPSKKFAVTIE
jgi:hypothetical protein